MVNRLLLAACLLIHVRAFVVVPPSPLAHACSRTVVSATSASATSTSTAAEKRKELKEKLLKNLGQDPSSQPDPVLADPVTLQPVRRQVRLAWPYGELTSMVSSGSRSYPVYNDFIDMVAAEERNQIPFFSPRAVVTQELFRSPLTSFLYERGWRQNFAVSGFPGIDQEFIDLENFMAPILANYNKNTTTGPPGPTTIVDLSCGSGLMTRRLVKSKRWGRVIACDFSESMLRETRRRFLEEKIEPIPELVRGDASRLPFQSTSVEAIHAGAALHCWPRLEESLAECFRILRPGGRMYASTFEVNERLKSNSFRFFQMEELRKLFLESGFSEVDVRREGVACLIVKAVKSTESTAEEARPENDNQ